MPKVSGDSVMDLLPGIPGGAVCVSPHLALWSCTPSFPMGFSFD